MVDYRTDKNLAILEVNNPPVNALSYHVRQGLLDGIVKANEDSKVKAVIIIGKGRTFPSGADISEFGKPMKGPWLTGVGHAIEDTRKPVVCAIHGTALGGGLEIGLFCHYRISNKNAKVGFPEVNIGLLPGGEGTQRLPRLTGLAVAMDMITSGRHVSATDAFKYGIIDKIVDGDLLSEAKSFALSVVARPLDNRQLKQVPVKDAENVDKLYDTFLKDVKQRNKGLIAPVNCLMAVKASAKLPYTQAIEEELKLFRELMSSSQSEALRYSFFAERAATKWKLPNGANASNTKPLPVKSVGVIGAGTMGSGITICLIRVGISVIMVEKNEKMLNKALKMIGYILMDSVKRKRMTKERRIEVLRLLKGSTTLDKLNEVDVVIEAVYENLDLKRKIFTQLDKICKPCAILCSNTSSLSIDKIAEATTRPDKVMGAHFFSPAYIMKLLENVYGAKTSATTVATIMQLGKTIGKVPVLVKTCTSFVANRMNQKFSNEAAFILEEGSLPQDIDRVLEDFGMPMGPFKVSDLAGIDIGWNIRQEIAKSMGVNITASTRYLNGERLSTLGDRLYEMGRLGRKTGKGWYSYEKVMGTQPTLDPDVTDLIEKHCRSLNIQRRAVPPQEIVERCILAAVNEGFRILEEGVAEKAQDIDVIWQYGFSFPRYRGGPMFYASQIGLKKVYERICHYHQTFPYSSYWVPSDLLGKLASHQTSLPIDQWSSYASARL